MLVGWLWGAAIYWFFNYPMKEPVKNLVRGVSKKSWAELSCPTILFYIFPLYLMLLYIVFSEEESEQTAIWKENILKNCTTVKGLDANIIMGGFFYFHNSFGIFGAYIGIIAEKKGFLGIS